MLSPPSLQVALLLLASALLIGTATVPDEYWTRFVFGTGCGIGYATFVDLLRLTQAFASVGLITYVAAEFNRCSAEVLWMIYWINHQLDISLIVSMFSDPLLSEPPKQTSLRNAIAALTKNICRSSIDYSMYLGSVQHKIAALDARSPRTHLRNVSESSASTIHSTASPLSILSPGARADICIHKQLTDKAIAVDGISSILHSELKSATESWKIANQK